MGRYRKIDVRIWNDEKFRTLGGEAMLVWFYVLTGPDATPVGLYHFSVGRATDDLGLSAEAVRAHLQALEEREMLRFDQLARLIYLPNWLRYNPPAGGKQRILMVRHAKEYLPHPFADLVLNAIEAGYGVGTEKVRDGYAIGTEKVRHEQEQEQEQEQDLKDGSSERLTASGGSHSKPAAPARERKRATRKNFRPGTHGEGQVLLTIPLVGGAEAPVTEDFVAEMEKLFPGVNVRQELNKIRAYFIGKPQKRKTASGIAHSITAWLGKEQDRGKAPTSPPHSHRNDRPSAPVPVRTTDIRDVMIDEKLMREEYDIATGAVLKTFPHPSTRKRA